MSVRRKCFLDSVTKRDWADFILLHTSPDTRQYLGGVPSESDINTRFDKILKGSQSSRYWAIRTRHTPFLGLVELSQHHDSECLELSVQLLPMFFGEGYAFEACSQALNFSFAELGQSKVVAETQKRNTQCNKLLIKLGFKLERELYRFGETQNFYTISS